MNALIEATLNNGPPVLLNPHSIEWARPNTEGNAFISMKGGTDHWHLTCSYDEFRQTWIDALNYVKRFSDTGGVVTI